MVRPFKPYKRFVQFHAVSIRLGDTVPTALCLLLDEPGERRSGLANLAARADALGGSMRAEPAADGGTALEWRVPITDRP